MANEDAEPVNGRDAIDFGSTVEFQCKENFLGINTNYTCVQSDCGTNMLVPVDGSECIVCEPGKVQLKNARHFIKLHGCVVACLQEVLNLLIMQLQNRLCQVKEKLNKTVFNVFDRTEFVLYSKIHCMTTFFLRFYLNGPN